MKLPKKSAITKFFPPARIYLAVSISALTLAIAWAFLIYDAVSPLAVVPEVILLVKFLQVLDPKKHSFAILGTLLNLAAMTLIFAVIAVVISLFEGASAIFLYNFLRVELNTAVIIQKAQNAILALLSFPFMIHGVLVIAFGNVGFLALVKSILGIGRRRYCWYLAFAGCGYLLGQAIFWGLLALPSIVYAVCITMLLLPLGTVVLLGLTDIFLYGAPNIKGILSLSNKMRRLFAKATELIKQIKRRKSNAEDI